MMRLGELSGKYESNSDPAIVARSTGDAGGWSYGLYQFSSEAGTVQDFVEWLCRYDAPYDEYGRQLKAAGNPCCDTSFVTKWEELGNVDPDGFSFLQDEYVKPGYYDSGAENLLKWYDFDIEQHSNALQQVLFSNCIQHGSYYGAMVFGDGAQLAQKKIQDMSDSELIYFIYEVKLTDPSWSEGSPQLRPGLYSRWRQERAAALDLLEANP